MVKLTGLQIAERQPAKKGNIIVFSQPDAVKLLAERLNNQFSTVNDVFPILDGLH